MRTIIAETERKKLVGVSRFLVATGVLGQNAEKAEITPIHSRFVDNVRPRFVKPTDGHFFDIRKNGDAETAKVFTEERKTNDPRLRITNSEPVRTVNGMPQIEFSKYNVHAEAEFEATHRAFELAKDCNLIFWISAEDGAREVGSVEAKKRGLVYLDGRFNIYFRDEEGVEISLKGKHLPLSIDRFESLKLGQRLVEKGGKTLGKIDSVEDLRVQPIGFKLADMDDWIGLCREMMPEFELFWGAIEKGDDVRQEADLKKAVERAKLIAKGDNMIFQQIMAVWGYEINTSGAHGVDWLGPRRVRNFRIERVGNLFFTEPVMDGRGKLICPVCGAEVTEGETICAKCGIGLRRTTL